MRVLSWNIRHHGLGGRLERVVEALESRRPDIVLLQEVATKQIDRTYELLEHIGLSSGVDSLTDAPPRPAEYADKRDRKGYATLVASRWTVERARDRWRRTAPYPEAMVRATVHPEGGDPLDVFNVHIPNGSGNGWRKIATLDVLYRALIRAPDSPRLLAGDFNEPREYRRSGQIVSWGPSPQDDGSLRDSDKRCTDKFKTTRPGSDWTRGVMRVLAGAAHHGLRDAYRDRHGFDATPVTHLTTGGGKRCFDHAFVSRHFEVEGCGYHHDWRRTRLSDHSAMWIELKARSDLPELVAWQDDGEDRSTG